MVSAAAPALTSNYARTLQLGENCFEEFHGDGSPRRDGRCGQRNPLEAFQTAFVGVSSKRFGNLTFGRQPTLLTEGTVKYDPNYDATAFGLLGASGAYQGGGSSEDKRLDSMVKYDATFNDLVHVGILKRLMSLIT